MSGRAHHESTRDNEQLSPHPVDRLIRELIRQNRHAVAEEIEPIIERMATASFDPRVVAVPARLRAVDYGGARLGTQARSIAIHLAVRILLDEQWIEGTTEQEYLDDVRRAVRHREARLALYRSRGGAIAGLLARNEMRMDRRGSRALPWIYLVYSADRGCIITAYQASDLGQIRIPEDAQWLR